MSSWQLLPHIQSTSVLSLPPKALTSQPLHLHLQHPLKQAKSSFAWTVKDSGLISLFHAGFLPFLHPTARGTFSGKPYNVAACKSFPWFLAWCCNSYWPWLSSRVFFCSCAFFASSCMLCSSHSGLPAVLLPVTLYPALGIAAASARTTLSSSFSHPTSYHLPKQRSSIREIIPDLPYHVKPPSPF